MDTPPPQFELRVGSRNPFRVVCTGTVVLLERYSIKTIDPLQSDRKGSGTSGRPSWREKRTAPEASPNRYGIHAGEG